MKIKPVKQPNSIACGPTCVFLTLEYFGSEVGFKEIEKLTGYKKKDGMTDVEIVKTLSDLGYKAKRVLNATWNDLEKFNEKDTVIILSWMMEGIKGHVSILDRVTKDHIYLIDSELGKIIKLGKIHFMRSWMEYDNLWWPRVPNDINLRPMIIVKKL